ncbi:MAG: hypothetical protein ACQEWW_02420 [Bacillota bacterium]
MNEEKRFEELVKQYQKMIYYHIKHLNITKNSGRIPSNWTYRIVECLKNL